MREVARGDEARVGRFCFGPQSAFQSAFHLIPLEYFKAAVDWLRPVEKISGPVMVICGRLDSRWPSCRMSAQIIARLEANGFKHTFQLLEYGDSGSLGGSPASNNAARVDSWPKAVAFIDAALQNNAWRSLTRSDP